MRLKSSHGGRQLGLLAIVLVPLTIVRLIGLKFSVSDLFFDESQYWSWAQDPALGYPSKPPLLAWLLAGVHHVCGDEEWCVRSPAPVTYAATCLAIYALGRQLYDARTGFWAAILAAFTPGIVFSSRIFSTDVPLLFFWTVALLAYARFLQSPRGSKKHWGIVLGLCLGLGLLSKYAMIYFLPGMILASFANPRAAAVWREGAMWLAFLIAAVTVAPHIAWNVEHSLATVRHTGGLVLGEPPRPSLARLAEFLTSQLAVMGPAVFAVAMISALRLRSDRLISQDRLLLAFFVPPVAAVSMFAIYSRAYANWAAPSAVPALVAGTAILLRSGQRYWLWSSIALGIAVQSTLLITDAIATRLPERIGSFTNPYNRTLGWRDYAERAGRLATNVGAQTLAADDREAFYTLRYYWRDRPQAVVSWDTAGQSPFDFAHPLMLSTPEPVLFVTGCPDTGRLKEYFSAVEPVDLHPELQDTRARHFFAFKLDQMRKDAGPLPPCGLQSSLRF
jgi:hypothetical protein